MERVIAVIDLKAFYSYVECVDRNLDPWTTPLVVADKSRSVNTIVLSVTPYLKQHGVPSRLRLKELPKTFDYIYATPRMERYIEKSSEVVSIMLDFVARSDIFVYSIDEAFLDLTSYINYYNKTPVEIVEMIMQSIFDKTGLMATAGIGDNFFLAKIALDVYAKYEKNNIATLHKKDVPEKLWTIQPLTDVWGIGEKTSAKLQSLGIKTMKDLANSNRDFMQQHFGIMGLQLIDLANGIDDADMHEEYTPKEHSLSIGQVLWKDYDKKGAITIIREMNDDLANRMRNEHKKTGVVSLYIGYSAAESGGFNRQMSLLTPTDDNEVLFKALMEIYEKFVIDKPIRRININFGKLTSPSSTQLSLFEESQDQIQRQDLQRAIDKIQDKFGKNSLLRASALTEESTAKERHNQIGGHRK